MKRDRPEDDDSEQAATAKRAKQEDADYATVQAKHPSLRLADWRVFKQCVLARPDDWTRPAEWGFKDERLDVLTKEELVGNVWHYFGNHGVFIGGEPATELYHGSRMVEDATTPFERMYYVYRGTKECPLVAVRLRADVYKAGPIAEHKQKRVFDAMEILHWTKRSTDGLHLYALHKEEDIPEALCDIPEGLFLEHFPAAQQWV